MICSRFTQTPFAIREAEDIDSGRCIITKDSGFELEDLHAACILPCGPTVRRFEDSASCRLQVAAAAGILKGGELTWLDLAEL